MQLYLKRESDTGDFLLILQNFQEYLLYRTPPRDSIWRFFLVLSHSFIHSFMKAEPSGMLFLMSSKCDLLFPFERNRVKGDLMC